MQKFFQDWVFQKQTLSAEWKFGGQCIHEGVTTPMKGRVRKQALAKEGTLHCRPDQAFPISTGSCSR